MTAAVLGARGYGGQVLMRLLLGHPGVRKILPVSSSKAGQALTDRGIGQDSEEKLPPGGLLLDVSQAVAAKPDVVFAALPPGVSAQTCAPFFANSVVVDLSADFRLQDPEAHQQFYGNSPPRPDLRKNAVYGLVEIHREALKSAEIIAVPGCYPTCILLPLLPLAAAKLLQGPIVVNALTGISGAGKKAQDNWLFVERSENAVAYNPGLRHRHLPEILQALKGAGSDASLYFTPHLIPLRRGMVVTTAVPATETAARQGPEYLEEVLEKAYSASPFVRLRRGEIPAARDVLGSNRCDIGWTMEKDQKNHPGEPWKMVYLFSALDNLLKGAAGQAVQAFNIRFGFDETTGLPISGTV